MINLKKIVAVALTAAMCLGMSVTAFAKVGSSPTDQIWNSPNQMNGLGKTGWDAATGKWTMNGQLPVVGNGATITSVTDQYGVELEVNAKVLSKETLDSINSEKKVRDIFEKAGYDIADGYDVFPILATELTLDSSMGANGAYAWINVGELGSNPAGYTAGQKIQVLRETFAGSGEWEVVEAELVESEGRLQARVQMTNRSQSLVVVRITSDGKTVKVIPKDNPQNAVTVPVKPADKDASTATSTGASASASPKTGEF